MSTLFVVTQAQTEANKAMADSFAEVGKATAKSADETRKLGDAYKNKMGDVALGALEDFGSGAAKAFGIARAGGESFSTAIGSLMKSIVADMASQFGRLFVLKGAALAIEAPAIGIPMIAAGLALQAFGGAVGFSKGKTSPPSTTTAAATPSFQPREQEREEPRETTLVINIAGETIGPVIWRAMDEGLRLGHVTQMQGA